MSTREDLRAFKTIVDGAKTILASANDASASFASDDIDGADACLTDISRDLLTMERQVSEAIAVIYRKRT